MPIRKIDGKSNVIGKNIKKYRELQKISQRELSNKIALLGIDIHHSAISDIENEKVLLNEIEASLNKLIDACVENFNIENDKIVYYKKADTEIIVKSSIRLRQIMWDKLDNMKSQYDISIQKLINLAIKYTLEMYDNEKKKLTKAII